MICKTTKKECVYDEYADICNSHCNQITIGEIERQKNIKTKKELEEKRDNLLKELGEINERLNEMDLDMYDFTNKFIYSKTYGYMYVTWHTYDKSTKKVLLQGIKLNSNCTQYRDAAYFDFDAMGEWYIPYNIFMHDVKSCEMYEITKKHFMDKVCDSTTYLKDVIEGWVNKLTSVNSDEESD